MSHNITHQYSLAEEIVNSISHGAGTIFGIIALLLLLLSPQTIGALEITSFSIYGTSIIILFLASTLYHAITHKQAKHWLRLFDHCAIYLLIAGTYTPLLLITIKGTLGISLMIIIWTLAIVGIILKLVFPHRFHGFSSNPISDHGLAPA